MFSVKRFKPNSMHARITCNVMIIDTFKWRTLESLFAVYYLFTIHAIFFNQINLCFAERTPIACEQKFRSKASDGEFLVGFLCFERKVSNQILCSLGLPGKWSLFDTFLNLREWFRCILATYDRYPLIQPHWPSIAGWRAIACDKEFGFEHCCFMRETPSQKVCLAGP